MHALVEKTSAHRQVAVHASAFHPMRGHVAAGVVVLFGSGERLTVNASTLGWELRDDAGRRVSPAGLMAEGLTRWIVQRDLNHAHATDHAPACA